MRTSAATRVGRLRRGPGAPGQSLVELTLLLPIVVIMLLGAVDVAQVLSTQQHLENATYEAALQLLTTPSLNTSSKLAAYIQTESGLSPVSAASRYSIGAGSDQVVVTASYNYPLILPGIRNLQIGGSGSGYFNITVSSASIATTNPPSVSDASGTVKVVPPSDTTVPSGLSLTCTLFRNATPVPTPQACPSSGATWSHVPTTITNTYTATVMQLNGVISPPSTAVAGP